MLAVIWIAAALAGDVGASVGALFWQGTARLEPAPMGAVRVSAEAGRFFGVTGEIGLSGNRFTAEHHDYSVFQVRPSAVAEIVLRRQRVSARFGLGPYVAVRPTTLVAEDERYDLLRVDGGVRARGALVVPLGDEQSRLQLVNHVAVHVGLSGAVDVDAGVGLGWVF
jgi:hypothetical protein